MARWLHLSWALVTVACVLFCTVFLQYKERSPPVDDGNELESKKAEFSQFQATDPRENTRNEEGEGLSEPDLEQHDVQNERAEPMSEYTAAAQLQVLTEAEREEVCKFFKNGYENIDAAWWEKPEYYVCAHQHQLDFFDKAERNCLPCDGGPDACANPQRLLFHQFVDTLHEDWQGTLLSVKSFLLTQNLSRSHFYLWVSDFNNILTHDEVKNFLLPFHEYVTLNRVDWTSLIEGTPLEHDPFYNDEESLKARFPISPYTDILRKLLLWKFGGVWVDNDVILLRDWYPITYQVGLQWMPRWANGHVLFFKPFAPSLGHMLQFMTTLHYNEPDEQTFLAEQINKICKPLGYFQVSPHEYGYADVYNGCVLLYGIKTNNTGPLTDRLAEYPIGWFDPSWPSCYDARHTASTEDWLNIQSRYYALHTRWPKVTVDLDPLHTNSALHRAITILTTYFDSCKDAACVHKGPAFLRDFGSSDAQSETEEQHGTEVQQQEEVEQETEEVEQETDAE